MITNCYEISMSPYTLAAKHAVPGYTKMTVNELADGYCAATDNGDEFLRDGYMSALVLRFWSKISKVAMENASLGIEYSDGYDWITGSIMQACDPSNRKWQTNPKINASQVINQILATRYVAAAFYESNLQKNQGRLDQCSLDEVMDSESETTVGDLIEDESASVNPSGGQQVVQALIDNNKLVEAIIIDNVLTKDVFKPEKTTVVTNGVKYSRVNNSFWSFKMVQELNELDEEYIKEFMATYAVPKKMFMAAFEDLKKASNNKKYKLVSATREYLRNNAESYL